MAIAVFCFDESSNLLKKYLNNGIDLTNREQEERLRKIVSFFTSCTSTNIPNSQDHGLAFDYKKLTKYIMGPYASFEGQGSNRSKEHTQME